MSLINAAPKLLQDYSDTIPQWLHTAYAMHVITSMTGISQMSNVEELVLRRIRLAEMRGTPVDADEQIMTDADRTQDDHRMAFEATVQYVLAIIPRDGFMSVRDSTGVKRLTDSPRKIADALAADNCNVTDAHVRRAQQVLDERGTRQRRWRKKKAS